jgi:hypothetical protein
VGIMMLPTHYLAGFVKKKRYVICCIFLFHAGDVSILRVSADVSDLYQQILDDPCGIWPEQDRNEPCKCGTSCKADGDHTCTYFTWGECKSYNVAYNKPVTVSSPHTCYDTEEKDCNCLSLNTFNKQLSPCGIVNSYHGTVLSNHCNPAKPTNCIQTAPHDSYAWIEIDLMRPYVVRALKELIRYPYSIPKDESAFYHMINMMESLDAQVVHTWLTFDKLHKFNEKPNAQGWYDINFFREQTGRYVRIEKRPN